MGADFYAKMLKEIGQKEMDKLQADRQVTTKALDHYLALIEEYKSVENSLDIKS